MTPGREWMWVDYILAVIRSVYYAIGILYYLSHPDEIAMSTSFFYLWLSLCILVPHFFWRPGFIHDALFAVTELILVGSFHLYFIFYLQVPFGISLLLMPALIIGSIARKQTLFFAPAVLLMLTACTYYTEPYAMSIFNYALALAMLFVFGYICNRLLYTQLRKNQLLAENQRQTELIQSQNKTLQQYADKVEELTLLSERNRIAGELHDTVGHTFTSVIVGMDAVLYLMDASPEKAKDRLVILREAMTSGLMQLREQIHNIADADEELFLSKRLKKLAHEFSEYTGTDVTIHTYGTEYEIPRPVAITLSRCLQEALTNARRHGGATEVAVHLHFSKEEVRMIIKDNGTGSTQIEAGFGLQTMKERLSLIQGKMAIHSRLNNGTQITCSISMKGVHDEDNKTVAGR